MKFDMTVTVTKTIEQEINMTMEADDLAEATEKAYEVARVFPDAHREKEVYYCFVDRQEVKDVVVGDITWNQPKKGPKKHA